MVPDAQKDNRPAAPRIYVFKKLILFPELEHNCWNTACSDEKNYDWLLSFTSRPNNSDQEDPSLTYYG